MRKRDVLFKLNKDLEKARKRQLPNAEKDSGYIRGLKSAIKIIEMQR